MLLLLGREKAANIAIVRHFVFLITKWKELFSFLEREEKEKDFSILWK